MLSPFEVPLTGPVVCFGEALLRLDTPGNKRFLQADQFLASYAGGEANVAVALSYWGLPARLVSKVPAHELGAACLKAYQAYGVDTSHVIRGGKRLGIFFVENSTSLRGPQVLYDRAGSSFAESKPEEYHWPDLLEGARWFHFTGTVPAVGPETKAALLEALTLCRQRGIVVSFDVGYRSALWSVEEAGKVFRELIPWVDVLIGSEQDATQFFEVPASTAGHSTPESREQSLRALADRTSLKAILYSHRTVNDLGVHRYCASLLARSNSQVSAMVVHTANQELMPIDRIGTGDALAAGLIRGLLLGHAPREVLDFAFAAALVKHSIEGDFALVNVPEIQRLATGGSLTQVRR